ncbi:hypothetical protein GQ53DRAFT_838936 [Thozetella sp. PMI_491]|nr:hypothetical protein GQ53DRAFT_838936 [Thozetella sp. PMI_491]
MPRSREDLDTNCQGGEAISRRLGRLSLSAFCVVLCANETDYDRDQEPCSSRLASRGRSVAKSQTTPGAASLKNRILLSRSKGTTVLRITYIDKI